MSNQWAEIKPRAVTAVCLPTGDVKYFVHPRDTNKLAKLLATSDLAWYTAGGEVPDHRYLHKQALRGLEEEMDIKPVPLYVRYNEGISPRQKSEIKRRKRQERDNVHNQTEY